MLEPTVVPTRPPTLNLVESFVAPLNCTVSLVNPKLRINPLLPSTEMKPTFSRAVGVKLAAVTIDKLAMV